MVDYYDRNMSGSDDEFQPHVQPGMTKAELRRSNKPIMEKRRRARINQCLDELKSLILEAMKKDPSRHSKLEKADILEMTVKHLQTVQRQQLTAAVATDPAVLTKFRTGFSECATEVSRYVSHLENVDPAVKQRLVSHLNNCVSNLQQMAPFYGHYVPYIPERLFPEVKVGFQSEYQSGDENNNGSARIQIPSGVHLIPSRLPTGELALLVPQSAGIAANFPFFPPANEASSRVGQSSAFTAVTRSHSPLVSPSTSTSSIGEDGPHSPGHRRFKAPDGSSGNNFSSPEMQLAKQLPQSPAPPAPMEPKLRGLDCVPAVADVAPVGDAVAASPTQATLHSLRQPLTVITDKSQNRSTIVPAKKEGLKRHRSDGLLTISEKRLRFEAVTSTTTLMPPSRSSLANVSQHRDQDSGKVVGSASSSSTSSASVSSTTNGNCKGPEFPSSTGVGDMWRPW
ncbi:transcription factor HES-1-like [Orussus abietinus]|uniref:transcription factor HES-1-like n=1 Tax=Orussus abietinus TaxID=222816 RepID=UPI000625E4C2|nr:transcription factor HES-1-like [Orussus abietinus]